MADVNISIPFVLSIDITEVEDHLPSLKVKVHVDIPHPTGNIVYDANDIWFACDHWENFTKSLDALKPGETTTLHDLSEYFLLNITFKTDSPTSQYDLYLSIKEPIPIKGLTSLQYSSPIDTDVFSHIRSEFNKLIKIW